jgi:hypothetical protein
MSAAGNKLEFLREAVPHLHRLAIMTNVGNPASVLEMGEAQAAARKLGFEVTTSEIRRAFANRCAAMLRALGAASTCIGQCRPSSRIVRVGAARPNSSRERTDQVEPITAVSEARIVLSQMAEVWLRLAERGVLKQTQPAFQQQQQIQAKDDDKE